MERKLFFFLFLPVLCHGQLEKGAMSFGGGFNISGDNRDETVSTSVRRFDLELQPGYFISDHGMVGLLVGYSSTKFKTSAAQSADNNISIGAFYSHYFPIGDGNFALTLTPGLAYLLDKDKTTSGSTTTTIQSTGFNMFVEPGMTYFFNVHWGFELRFVGLQYSNPEGSNNDVVTFGVNSFGFSSIGIRYYFRL